MMARGDDAPIVRSRGVVNECCRREAAHVVVTGPAAPYLPRISTRLHMHLFGVVVRIMVFVRRGPGSRVRQGSREAWREAVVW